MAANVLADLDSQLASLNQLKPPGASKGKIGYITQLCINNVQTESSIVQSLYRALKKAPATHKLGALYVIDSVVRQWIEKAKQSGQQLNFDGRGEPGTYSAAVKRVTELMPALFDDIIKALPSEQKPKLENMIGIWAKGSTFPVTLLADFRARLSSNAVSTDGTSDVQQHVVKQPSGGKFMAPIPSRPVYTPVGFPSESLRDQGVVTSTGEQTQMNGHNRPPTLQSTQPRDPPSPAFAPPSDVNSILAALANAAPKPVAPTPTPAAVAVPPPSMPHVQQLPPELAAYFSQQGGFPGMMPPPQSQTPAYPVPSMPPAMQFPGFPPQGLPQFNGFPPQPSQSVAQTFVTAPPPPPQSAPATDLLGPLRGILPQNIIDDPNKLVKALSLLQDLQQQGLPMDQWGPILQAFDRDAPSSHTADNDDHGGHDRYGGRDRSRSPDRRGRGRGSPVYGSYDENRQGGDDRDNHGNANGTQSRYRQRSPMGTRDSPGVGMSGRSQAKLIEYDYSLPPDHIKVLSRTLFVGGANGSQSEIHQLFERFGRVQTCIANQQKRHAFVKMTTREYALAARAGMEDLQNRNDREAMALARQTKWGVGFGPRECCDYQRGESTIPIHKLTDADVKWLLTAEYGGTGGKSPEGGMVIEEPDIEIGAGVSSKAMSKRVLPDTGPPAPVKRVKDMKPKGKYEHRHHDRDRESGGFNGYAGAPPSATPQHMEAYGYHRPEPVAVATPPAVPTFGFSLPTMNGSNGAYR